VIEANNEFDNLMLVRVHSVEYNPNHIIAHVEHVQPN